MNEGERLVELSIWGDLLTTRQPSAEECLALRKVLLHTANFVGYAYRENRRLARQCNQQAGLENGV